MIVGNGYLMQVSPCFATNGYGDQEQCTPKCCGATALIVFAAGQASAASIGDVFVISMENQNWTQPTGQFTGGQQQIKNNPAAPFLNNLVQGNVPGISNQTAYTDTYYNVLASPTNTTHIHPRNQTTSGQRPDRTSACSMTTIRSGCPAAPTRPPIST